MKQGQPDDNVIINLVQKVVDQSVSMLVGEAPTFDLPGDDGEKDEGLTRVWKANEYEMLLHNLAVSGALAGHAFVKLMPDERRGVRLVNLNPRLASVFWRPDDKAQVVCYRIQWEGANDTTFREDMVARGKDWLVRDLKRARGEAWVITSETTWQYPFAPVVDWQNLPNGNDYYGDSDLYNAGLNDAVNFVASNVNRILKIHAHPKTIGIGVGVSDVKETAVDGFWAVLNSEAKVNNLEMQSDLGSSMAYLDFLQASFYSQHRAVDLTGMKDRVGQLTNFGLRTLFKDALDKLRTKQTLYGNGLAEVSYRMGVMLGKDWEGARVKWGDALPFNQVEQVETVKELVAHGILSKQSGAEELGYDWSREQERLANEKANEKAGLGAALANAMRSFDGGNEG